MRAIAVMQGLGSKTLSHPSLPNGALSGQYEVELPSRPVIMRMRGWEGEGRGLRTLGIPRMVLFGFLQSPV